jgi:large subunit ribosomal protein L14e
MRGAIKSGSKKRIQVRIPSGNSVLRFKEKRPGKATCPTGRELPGTVRGNAAAVRKFTTSQRKPSRPYGGVLSSPAMRAVMLERVNEKFETPSETGKLYEVGTVCMKLAGRDAGKLCVVTEVLDNLFVKVDGYTRPRKVNLKHLQPTGKTVDVKKGATSKDIQALLQ